MGIVDSSVAVSLDSTSVVAVLAPFEAWLAAHGVSLASIFAGIATVGGITAMAKRVLPSIVQGWRTLVVAWAVSILYSFSQFAAVPAVIATVIIGVFTVLTRWYLVRKS